MRNAMHRGGYAWRLVIPAVEYRVTRMLAIAAEFQPSILEEVTGHLGDAAISVKAIAADASGLRVFPVDVERAKEVLTDAGYFCQVVEVLHIKVANQAGTFHEAMKRLRMAEAKIISSFGMGIGDEGAIYVRVDDLERAKAALDD